MKIGVISDIHSNVAALESVFNEFKIKGVEKIICLGDFIGIGPFPEKCVKLIMDNNDKILSIIKGNHERYLTDGLDRRNHTETDARPMTDEDIKFFNWNHARLNNEEREYIRNLENREELFIEGKKIIVEHYAMKDEKKYKKFIKNPTLEELLKLYDDKQADIYLFGHTHKEVFMEHNKRYYINPGSLGCPEDNSVAKAGIIDIENGEITYTQLNVPYDKQKVIEEIKKLNYPKCQHIINGFYIGN